MTPQAEAPSPFPIGYESAYLPPTKYLRFEQVPNQGRKTSIWKVVSQSNGVTLGRIKWYAAWRQYCFYPEQETIWNPDCLASITRCIETCNRWRHNIRTNLALAHTA